MKPAGAEEGSVSVFDSVPTTAAVLRADEPVLDEAELAAVAFLARYGGRTLASYRADLRQYLAWIASVRVAPLHATRAHLELYRAWMEERGLAAATVDRRRGVMVTHTCTSRAYLLAAATSPLLPLGSLEAVRDRWHRRLEVEDGAGVQLDEFAHGERDLEAERHCGVGILHPVDCEATGAIHVDKPAKAFDAGVLRQVSLHLSPDAPHPVRLLPCNGRVFQDVQINMSPSLQHRLTIEMVRRP